MEDITEFEVQLHEVDQGLKARLKSLFNYMQSSADRHSRKLGTSAALMSEKNLTWVYSRFYTVIESYPDMYNRIFCQTWRSAVINGHVRREFVIRDLQGAVILRATSSLALIDRTVRKPVPIPEFITSTLEHDAAGSMDFPPNNIEQPDEFDYIATMKARYDDIDFNGHMNNSSYAGLFFESIYEKFRDAMTLRSIDISFKGEIVYGDELECSVAPSPDGDGKFYHRLFNKTKGRVSAYAVTAWENKL